MKSAYLRCAFLTLVLLLVASFALGQATKTYGRISGVVKDQTGGVIPGVTVTLTSNTGTKTAITGNSGEFNFPFLVPGKYDVKAELDGFKTYEQKGVNVPLGQVVTLTVVMQPGQISEVVTVTGEAPLVDTTTTTIGANISNSLYASIPIRRNFTNLFYLAPGVASGGGTGAQNPSIGGASGLENNYVVDGVTITNTGYGSVGSYSNVYGSLGSGVNFDFIKAVQVKAGGFEAEYGESMGGVINVVTKSGSNDFHGGVYFYGQPQGFQAARRQPNVYRQNKGTEVMAYKSYDVSFDLGGYLKQDKFFFYFGFNPQWQTSYRRAPAGYGQDLNGLKLYERDDHIYSWSGKLTYVPHPNHTFEFSTFADPSNRGMGPNRSMMGAGDMMYSKLHYGSWNWIARYNGVLTNYWFVTATLGRAYNRFEEAFLHGDLYGYLDYVDYFYNYYLPTHPGADPGNYARIREGGPGFYENNSGENWQFNLKSSFNFSAAGDHTVDVGYQYEDITYTAFRRYTGPMVNVPAFGTFPGGATYGAFVYREWISPRIIKTGSSSDYIDINNDGVIDANDAVWRQVRGNVNNPAIGTDTKYHSFYVQDAWKASNHITFKLGLRYDYQKMSGSGPNAESYTFDGNWAERIGMIYDVFGDGKTKVYGSFGRFYEKIPNDIAVRSLSVEQGITNVVWGDAALTNFLNDDLGMGSVGYVGGEPTYIVPGTKTGYQNEFVLGLDHEISPTLSFGARYIWRNVERVLEDVGGLTVEQFNAGGTTLPDGSWWWYPYAYVIANPHYTIDIFNNQLGSVEPDGQYDGFPDAQRSYNALELTLTKRFSQGFQFLANYRYSKLWGNYEGLFRNDNGQDDPNITSLFDFRLSPGIGLQYEPGYLNTDRTHVFNFNGSYTFPSESTFANLTLGIGIRLQSGTPITPLGTHPAYQNDGEIPLKPRGADGRTPWINNVDMHMDYPFTFADKYKLRFGFDLFNVFNRRRATFVDQDFQHSFDPNPDYKTATAFQLPFQARFSIRFEF